MDIYLLEGAKTLFRFGVGLLKLFKRQLKANHFPSGESFWTSLATECGTPRGVNIDDLVGLALDTNRGFFQRKSVPSRAEMLAIENRVKAQSQIATHSLNLPPPPELSQTKVFHDGITSQQSRLMDEEARTVLNSFLPPAARMEGFELMFATYNDGWSFDGLYHRTAHLSPCLIVIKSIQSHALVGMYLSTPISPPSFAITGDGQCFCFRLDGVSAAKHEWTPHSERANASATSSTWDQFALCAPEYMAFGGSEKFGTNAIRLDSGLTACSTGHSDTYSNPGLVPELGSSTWSVMDVEVFCGKALVTKRGLKASTAEA
jgi:hypothetical protein